MSKIIDTAADIFFLLLGAFICFVAIEYALSLRTVPCKVRIVEKDRMKNGTYFIKWSNGTKEQVPLEEFPNIELGTEKEGSCKVRNIIFNRN